MSNKTIKNKSFDPDQRIFKVSEKQYNAFVKALNEPIPNAEKLKKLLITPSPWEK